MTALVDNRECAKSYSGTLFDFGTFRVAVCRDGLQWLLQRRRGDGRAEGAEFETFAYCQTRAALIRLLRPKIGADAEALLSLPEHIRDHAS